MRCEISAIGLDHIQAVRMGVVVGHVLALVADRASACHPQPPPVPLLKKCLNEWNEMFRSRLSSSPLRILRGVAVLVLDPSANGRVIDHRARLEALPFLKHVVILVEAPSDSWTTPGSPWSLDRTRQAVVQPPKARASRSHVGRGRVNLPLVDSPRRIPTNDLDTVSMESCSLTTVMSSRDRARISPSLMPAGGRRTAR